MTNDDTLQQAHERLHRVEEETHRLREKLSQQGITIDIPADQPLEIDIQQLDEVILRTLHERTRQRDEAEAYAESIVATMHEPLLVLDELFRIVGANRAFYREFHTTPEDSMGRVLFELENGQWDITPLRRLLKRVSKRSNAFEDLEIARFFPRFGHRVMRINARRITPDTAEAPRIVLVMEDITARQRAEREREQLVRELELHAAELDATFASIPDGLVIYGADGGIVRMNAAAETMLSYPVGETDVSRGRVETTDGRPLTAEEMPGARALRGEVLRGVILVFRPPEGEARWVSTSAAPIRTLNGQMLGAVATFTDFTTQHALQEQRELLVQMVSHDLRIPLAVVHGHAELLEQDLEGANIDGQLLASVKAVRRGTERMQGMIRDLVDAARQEGGQLQLDAQPVALRPFVLNLLQRARPVLATERVVVEISPDLPPVYADPDRLERIFTNLLSNAVKYAAPDTPVLMHAAEGFGEVLLSVRDQGPGIAPEDHKRIFERFYRAKGARKAEGLGLGLYITKMLVDSHGGRIWVESTPGEGSIFYFTLPMA